MTHDLDRVLRLVIDRFDSLEQTLAARMETLDQRRAHGDSALQQSVDHLEGRVSSVVRDLGGLDAKAQRIEADTNRGLAGHREQLKETLTEELSKIARAFHDGLDHQQHDTEKVKGRVETIETKLDAVKWAAVGVGIGSGVTSGGLVALLIRTLGTFG